MITTKKHRQPLEWVVKTHQLRYRQVVMVSNSEIPLSNNQTRKINQWHLKTLLLSSNQPCLRNLSKTSCQTIIKTLCDQHRVQTMINRRRSSTNLPRKTKRFNRSGKTWRHWSSHNQTDRRNQHRRSLNRKNRRVTMLHLEVCCH